MKRCNTCDQDKPLEEFSRKGKGFQSKCKSCHKIYRDAHYRNNAEKNKAQIKARRQSLREQLNRYKESLPCKDCHRHYIAWVMEFDHLDDKEDNISSLIARGWSWERILEEIQKCDLVCANCHRIRTHQRYAEVAQLVEY